MKIKCKKCNNKIELSSKYCEFCGNKTNTVLIIVLFAIVIYVSCFGTFISLILDAEETDSVNEKVLTKKNSQPANNNKEEKNENNTQQNQKQRQETKKEDYEFDTIKGYSTLQSLILTIDDNTKYKRIKKMAQYYDYYIKDSTGVEAEGIIKIIYNTDEEHYYTDYTERAIFYFYDFSGKKLWKIEYSTNNYIYTYYASNHSSNNIYKYGENRKYIQSKKEAFNYINKRIGYKG